MTPDSQGGFRAALLIFATVLAVLAIWFTIPEIVRHWATFVSDRTATHEFAAAQKAAARWAAKLGIVRGDLWAEYALAHGDLLAVQSPSGVPRDSREAIVQARAAAERALSLSPHDARVWLLLAALDSRIERFNHQSAAALKMSYYTGSNETDLTPLRLIIAARSGAAADDDLQQLLRHELYAIMSRKSSLRPAVVAAYREADSKLRRLIETVISDLDPAFLASVRAAAKE